MRIPDSHHPAPKVNDEFVVIKSMSRSSVVYKDHRVVHDKKVSHYLFSLWVDYDCMKECGDALKWCTAFKVFNQE